MSKKMSKKMSDKDLVNNFSHEYTVIGDENGDTSNIYDISNIRRVAKDIWKRRQCKYNAGKIS